MALEDKYDLDSIDTISYALAVNVDCLAAAHGTGPARGRSATGSPFASSVASYGTGRPDVAMQDEQGQQGEQTMCLLADRNRVAGEYAGKGDYTFYPLGFHPAYGNFASRAPPRFLARDQLAIIKDNMSYLNDGADILDFGYFQA